MVQIERLANSQWAAVLYRDGFSPLILGAPAPTAEAAQRIAGDYLARHPEREDEETEEGDDQ